MSRTDEDVDNIPTDSEYGEEGDEEEEEEEEEEDVLSIYDSDTFISGPVVSEECTIPENILEFDYSYGYESRKFFNLTVADPDTLVFSCGNLLVFFDVPTREITFRRSALGGGIGHIKANPIPEFNHIAVAENGSTPLIIIYEWPNLDINCVLRGGAEKIYSHLDYSSDGLLLVSQSGEPDYLITVFNWPKRRILLRTKSYVNDVYRVKFSPCVPGQLTTCGISHIKFWKMATTFTGLKLKGDIGRFGKTEFSDIIGVLPMPDEKVVSGCAWGNILVWDAGLIKLEVFRTLRRKCHDAPIVQIYYDEGELMTVSMDGHVKIWWYEKIDQADPPDEDRIIQIEPLYDFSTPGVMLMCIRKRYPDKSDSHFFAQDGNGGIWIIDLNTEIGAEESERLLLTHAGKVFGIAACPWGPFLASLGEGGRLFIYDYIEKRLLLMHIFSAGGTCMIWLSLTIAEHGDEMVLGFTDGTLRLCIITIEPENKNVGVIVTQAIKPHEKPITQIAVNQSCSILISGSEDCTIFVFKIALHDHVSLVPIGYIRVPNVVTCFTWHFRYDDEILVGCLRGEIVQVKVPHRPQDYTGVSFLLKDLERTDNKFKTYKAQIRRDIKIREIEARKAEKVEKKRVKMEELKKENPHLEIDEEVFLADSESEEELEPLHIPEIPNKVIWMQSTPEDNIWLSMGGYDAGYIYEYKIDQKEEAPRFFKMVDDADDTEISSYIYNHTKKYLIFAMETGEIRVNKLKNGNHRDLSDYWTLAMHNNQNGFVPNMCFSYDEKYFFSCGYDGNVFAYKFNPEEEELIAHYNLPRVTAREKFPIGIEDEPQFNKLSLEQESLKREQDRIDRLANKNKGILREKLKKLNSRFFKLMKRNQLLKESQVIPQEDLELDKRITEYIDMKFQQELDLVKRKLAFDVQKSEVLMNKLKAHLIDDLSFFPIIVKGLNSNCYVKMLRQRVLDPRHEEMLKIVDQKIIEDEAKSRPPERPPAMAKVVSDQKKKERGIEYFLINLSPSIIENRLGPKLTRLLHKYRDRKLKWEKRNQEWEEFLAKKPVIGVNHPDDEVALKTAKETIGDYKLKSAKDYKVAKEDRVSTVNKYKQLLLTRERQYNIRHEFNAKVWKLREEKVLLRKELLEMRRNIKEIYTEIPESCQMKIPTFEKENTDVEFPEKKLEVKVTLKIEEDEDYYFAERVKEEKIFIDTQMFYDFDKYQKGVLPERSDVQVKKTLQQKDIGDICELDFEELFKFSENKKQDTPWESETRKRRLGRKLFEQKASIKEIERKIENFNKKIVSVADERFTVEVNAKIMDIFIITLHQELIILQNFESLENELQDKVNHKILEVLDMEDIIRNITDEIEEHNKEIAKCNDELKNIQQSFNVTVQDNRFFDFLRKVFKKKYRPPKVHTDDDSSSESSSSSSSSSEEEDAKSIDSRDFGIIKQDLNVCPKGCDPAIFEYTVTSRTRRHQVEIKIKEEQKTIELLKKDLEIQNKKVKLIEKSKDVCQEELEKFQSEKQRRLNEVRGTIFLKLSQIQHLTAEDKRSEIMDTLVFSKSRLSKLYKRVDELQIETEKQLRKHQADLKHLTRMNTDCEYMKRQIKALKLNIQEHMMIKFGKPVDINEIEEGMLKRTFGKDDISDLEEVLLKRLVHDLRLSLMDLKGIYLPELNFWQNAIVTTQKDLAMILRNNTSRRELLTLLGKEKVELTETLTIQERKKLHLSGLEQFTKKFIDEIHKLENIVEDQKQQIQDLKDEIKMLKTKGLPPKPVKKETDEDLTKLEGMLDGIKEDDEFGRKPFSTDFLIPMQDQAKEAATELIKEMLELLELRLNKKSTENFIKETLNSVMRRLSVTELVEDLIRNLPIEVSEDQKSIIEDTAENLLIAHEPDASDEDINRYLTEILEDIVDDVLLAKEGPQSMIYTLVRRLVDNLPIDFLLKKDSLELLVWKLLNANIKIELDRKEYEAKCIAAEYRKILDGILEEVFATGLDIIYYRDIQ